MSIILSPRVGLLEGYRYNGSNIAETFAAAGQIRQPEILLGEELENFNAFLEYNVTLDDNASVTKLQRFFADVACMQDTHYLDRQENEVAAIAFAQELQGKVRFGGYGFERLWVWILTGLSYCFSCAGRALAVKIEAFAYDFFQKMHQKSTWSTYFACLAESKFVAQHDGLQIRQQRIVDQKFALSKGERDLTEREIRAIEKVAESMGTDQIGSKEFWERVQQRLNAPEEAIYKAICARAVQNCFHDVPEKNLRSCIDILYKYGIFSPEDPQFEWGLQECGFPPLQ